MKSKIRISDNFTYGKLLRFTLPSIVMNIFLSLYIVVDGFFVANFVGKTEFAAVNLILPVLNIMGEIGYMFGVGGSALIAKTMGEKNQERANRLFSLMSWLGAEGSLLENSVLYGRIFILALPAWILSYAFQLFFVTAEKPRLGLLVTVFSGVCNMILDALFIIGFQWGIAGAAAASALAQIVGGVFPLIYFSRKNTSLLKLVKPVWDARSIIKSCTNGSSEFMAEAAASMVGLIYNMQLLKYAGEDGVVIYGQLMYVSLIFSAIFVGYSNGVGPVFSYHYGAQNHGELKNLRKRSLVVIGITSVAMFCLSEALAYPFSILFLQDAMQLVPISVHAFRIISFSYFFSGMAIFSSAFFTALNDGKVSALISFLRTFVFELGAVLLLPVLFGVEGIWCSVVIGDLMAAVAGSLFMVRLRRKYQY